VTTDHSQMAVPPDRSTESVREYWNAHPLGNQYIKDPAIQPGTPEYFDHVRRWMTPYKYPWIMERIDREAARARGRLLLEIGCGLGFVTIEFLRRDVRVIASDLSPVAVSLTRQHLAIAGFDAAGVQVENALQLSLPHESVDVVWSNGVLHHTGDTARALREVHRVLRPGGRAIISHFYRKPSWMYAISKFGRENIEYREMDPPVTDFMSEAEILGLFQGFRIEETYQDHYRALPIARTGLKAALYSNVFRPTYNLLPESVAKRFAYKFSVVAVKP
jgi:ubiquinone/menaquinone biosynthesis C-methylase UbiE